MSPFEYVIVLISVILGLGITTILTGIAELIKHRQTEGVFIPYIIWILVVFVLHIQEWWVSYQLKSVELWTLQYFLLIVLYPINLYILAHLLFPGGFSGEFNSREFYLKHHPRFFIGAIILGVLSTAQNIILSGLPVVAQIPKVVVFGILLVVVLRKNKNVAVHTFLSFLLLISLIVGLAVDQENLIIR
jgi:hypothetical protein